jgi:hypothetical protein
MHPLKYALRSLLERRRETHRRHGRSISIRQCRKGELDGLIGKDVRDQQTVLWQYDELSFRDLCNNAIRKNDFELRGG